MNRLIRLFKQLERNNNTYKDIYEGPLFDHSIGALVFDPIYWYGKIAFYIERTNKLTLDQPCITINIPILKFNLPSSIIVNNLVFPDNILRLWNNIIDELNKKMYNRVRPDKENGAFYTFRPNNCVVKRNITSISMFNQSQCISIKVLIQWPENNPNKAMRMTCKMLPHAVDKLINDFDINEYQKALNTWEQQQRIRHWLRQSDYCAFIANGSILPRESNSDKPLYNAVPFISPEQDKIIIDDIIGCGIRKGVTVITGGGYSGKSTLLDAISSGTYNHINGDGREYVITEESAMDISAEEGRSVRNVNISPFIKWVPNGNPEHFNTDSASGSTSQATNIIEAINCGCKLILIDEDRSATNFMIRDSKMKMLIKHEPIVPFTDRANELYMTQGVSTILVIGGSGEYLSIADNVILMDDYIPHNATLEAKTLCENKNDYLDSNSKGPSKWISNRIILKNHFTTYPRESGTEKMFISDMGFILFGDEKIDVRGVNNVISLAQLNAIAFFIRHMSVKEQNNVIPLVRTINERISSLKENDLDEIFTTFFPNTCRWLEMPRINEIYSVINRMKLLKFVDEDNNHESNY